MKVLRFSYLVLVVVLLSGNNAIKGMLYPENGSVYDFENPELEAELALPIFNPTAGQDSSASVIANSAVSGAAATNPAKSVSAVSGKGAPIEITIKAQPTSSEVAASAGFLAGLKASAGKKWNEFTAKLPTRESVGKSLTNAKTQTETFIVDNKKAIFITIGVVAVIAAAAGIYAYYNSCKNKTKKCTA